MSEDRNKVVIMRRKVALKWLKSRSKPYFQVTIYNRENSSKKTASLLRSIRDKKFSVKGMDAIEDLGVRESFDGVTLWSSDRKSLKKLTAWFEKRNYETTGVW